MPTNHTRLENTYRLLGVTVNTSFCLPKNTSVPFDPSPDLRFVHDRVESLPCNPTGTPAVYVSPYTLQDGQSLLYAYSRPEYDVLRFPHTGDFYVRPDLITCYELKTAFKRDVSRWLSGTVLALWLERRGIPVFHASAVVVDSRAIAFLGTNGAGKSSLAAAFMKRGYSMLTDDALAVDHSRCGRVMARPGYSQMRLWPDQAEYFVGHSEDLELVHPDATKRYVPVGPEKLGSFCDVPRPLGCLYIAARRDAEDSGKNVEITPLSSTEAVIELVRYSFTARLLAGLGLQAERLKTLAQIVQRIPVRRLTDPTGLQYLPATCDAILQDFSCIAE